MERVAFLIEHSGERVGCLLNPESLVLKRRAGIKSRRVGGDVVCGFNPDDDQLMLTGGGVTAFTLNLLFDVSLAGSSITTGDVRDLTGRLWALTENSRRENGRHRPPLCRFLWGKSWNIPAIVTSIAERLEYFDANGVPKRSWLRMRLRKVAIEPEARSTSGSVRARADLLPDSMTAGAGLQADTHVLLGSGGAKGGGERLDQLADRYYGNPGLWRLIAAYNGIDDPMHMDEGRSLGIPDLSVLEGGI